MPRATGNVTVSAGSVTLPTGTLAVAGSFDNQNGTFDAERRHREVHVNRFRQNQSAPTTLPSASLWFAGTAGGWTILDPYATATQSSVTVTAGTLTLNPVVFAVGGSFENTSGTHRRRHLHPAPVRFQTTGRLRFGGSSLSNIVMDGSGSWLIPDLNATTTGNLSILQGSTTLPHGSFAIGGSLYNAGTFNAATGTVIFNATSTGKTIDSGTSSFRHVSFNGPLGGWTITHNATSTGNFTLATGTSFTLSSGRTLAVGGIFRNRAFDTATTWTGSTLSLYGAAAFTVNEKTDTGDTYGTLRIPDTCRRSHMELNRRLFRRCPNRLPLLPKPRRRLPAPSTSSADTPVQREPTTGRMQPTLMVRVSRAVSVPSPFPSKATTARQPSQAARFPSSAHPVPRQRFKTGARARTPLPSPVAPSPPTTTRSATEELVVLIFPVRRPSPRFPLETLSWALHGGECGDGFIDDDYDQPVRYRKRRSLRHNERRFKWL
jgi:hypothetical protein